MYGSLGAIRVPVVIASGCVVFAVDNTQFGDGALHVYYVVYRHYDYTFICVVCAPALKGYQNC